MAVEQYTSKYTRKEIETGIDDVKGRVTNVESRIGTVEGNTSGLGELTNKVSALERGIQGVQSGVENAQKGVQGVQQELYGIQNKLLQADKDLGDKLTGVQNGLQSRVASLEGCQVGIQARIGGVQTEANTNFNGLKGRIDRLDGTQGYLWGKTGRTTSITANPTGAMLNADYRFNVVKLNATSTLTLSSGNLVDGQELYVFILGEFSFRINISNVAAGNLYIINPDGEKIENNSEIENTPAGFREMSIIKSDDYVFVRIA